MMQAMRARLDARGMNICLCGIDGSGKSTIAEQLLTLFTQHRIPARHAHLYAWYLNLTFTPALMLLNRFVLRRVVLYDRSFYDNIVMVCHNHSISGGLRTWLIRLGTALYPKFDRVIHLHASTSETLQRRPEFDESIVRSLSRTQAEVMDCVEHIAVPSNDLALRETLRALTGL